MLDLYELVEQHRVYVQTLDELHAIQDAVKTHHPDASLEYIGDDDWEDYPYIIVEDDVFEGKVFVAQWKNSPSRPTDLTVREFLAILESEQEADIPVDLSDCL